MCNSFMYQESSLGKNYHFQFELQVRYGLHWTSRNQNEICLPPSLLATHFHHNPVNNSGAEIKRVCGWIATDHLQIKNFMQFIKTHVTRHL